MIRPRTLGYHPQRLRGLLISYGFDPPSTFAPFLKISKNTMNCKIKGDSPWTRPQLLYIKAFFKLTPEQFCDIFWDTSEQEKALTAKRNAHEQLNEI